MRRLIRHLASAASEADLTICTQCTSRYVIPTDWDAEGEASWWMRLRCGECASVREVVVSNAVAQRYDQRLNEGTADIAACLYRLEHERTAAEVETFATALDLDLLDPGDFAR